MNRGDWTVLVGAAVPELVGGALIWWGHLGAGVGAVTFGWMVGVLGVFVGARAVR